MTSPRRRSIAYDAGALTPDATTIDALARLQLTARRLGFEIRVRNVSGPLQELLAFAGLCDVLRVETIGQPEEREKGVGVEEERELGDPAA